MQVTNKTTAVAVVTDGRFTARPIADDLSWGRGSIQPDSVRNTSKEQRRLTKIVLDSLAVINDGEKPYSSCTDGRMPVRLLSGEAVPVREQIVGTDSMLMFHMAEVLGPRFYKNPDAPLAKRFGEVLGFMTENGLTPCTHSGCGAAAAYVQIVQNVIEFAADERFISRQKALLPKDIYNDELREQITNGYKERLAKGSYEGWSDTIVTEAVSAVKPDRAIAELKDDGRGVYGHVEEQIIRIQAEGIATNELQVVARTGGREVFSVNDMRMRHLAELISRGHDDDYRLALMAAEDFTDGGHGTLAKNLPTYVITTK